MKSDTKEEFFALVENFLNDPSLDLKDKIKLSKLILEKACGKPNNIHEDHSINEIIGEFEGLESYKS